MIDESHSLDPCILLDSSDMSTHYSVNVIQFHLGIDHSNINNNNITLPRAGYF